MVNLLKKIEFFLCPPSVGVHGPPVVESATRYKCGQEQSAEAYVCRWTLLNPTPRYRGASSGSKYSMAQRLAILDASLRRIRPTAMGRTGKGTAHAST